MAVCEPHVRGVRNHRSRSRIRGLGLAVAVAVCPAALLAGESYAFLVGVADYDRKELKPLQFTRNDILELSKILADSGYPKGNIVLMHDDLPKLTSRRYLAEAAKIREELKLLIGALRSDDSLIVALSGHGAQFKGDARTYFCPADARLDDRRTLIEVGELYEQLKACKARQKLLLIDACRDDPQSNVSKSRQSVDLESVTRPQDEAVPEGMIAVFSCAAGQRSFEDPGLKHGIFFYHVLQGLKGAADTGDRRLTLDELIAFTTAKTESFARSSFAVNQTPHRTGDFTGTWVLRTLKPSGRPPESLVPGRPTSGPGDYDASFDGDGRVTALFGYTGSQDASAVAVQKDGKIVTVGQVEKEPGKRSFQMAVARHNPDGTPDNTFAGDGTVRFSFGNWDQGCTGRALAIQPDGKILVGGRADVTAYYYDLGVARLNPDGSFDKTFGNGGAAVVNASIAGKLSCGHGSLALQRDGKIVFAGHAGLNGPGEVGFAVIRLLPDGKLDPSFSGAGKLTVDFPGNVEEVNTAIVTPDGKIVFCGTAEGVGGRDAVIVRLKADGTLDTTFDGDGRLTIDFGKTWDNANYVVSQGSKLVLSLNTSDEKTSRSVLIRFNSDGSIDKSFGGSNTGTVVSRLQANGPVVLPDGRLLVASAVSDGIEIYSKDGVRDPRYGDEEGPQRTSPTRDVYRHATCAPDGTVYLAGNSPVADGVTGWLLAKLIAP